VCSTEAPWVTGAVEASEDLLLVVGRTDLEATALTHIDLQFDQPLKDVSRRPTVEVAELQDLGPHKGDCASSTESGYPKVLAITIEQNDAGDRLSIVPAATLPSGHRFRLEIKPSVLLTDAEAPYQYWSTAPTKFDFGTREVVGDPISGPPEGAPSLGTTNVARDMLKLGNLLLVASETGDLVAIDVTKSSDEHGLRVHSLKNKGVQRASRTLVTDGHNRIFYSGLFGSIWGIKAIRLEDIRKADRATCVASPSWAGELPCFEGVEGSVRVAYALGTQTGTTTSEWLAAGSLPEATPMDLEVLSQDEKGVPLDLGEFLRIYAGRPLSSLTPDDEGIYTFDVQLKSSFARSQSNELEPSLPEDAEPEPAVAEWRKNV
jgi:hypothetical protein